MSTLTAPEGGNMGSVSIKDVLPAMSPSYHISAIRLHEDVDLSGPLGIIEGYARRSSLCLSSPGVFSSATTPLSAGWRRWVWLFTHPVGPSPVAVSRQRPSCFAWFPLCSCQRVQQRLGLLQICRLKPLGEPAVDRRQELAGLFMLALVLP
jgi:hypothetical protein